MPLTQIDSKEGDWPGAGHGWEGGEMLAWISNYYLDQPDHLTGAINRCKMGWSDHRDTSHSQSHLNENQDLSFSRSHSQVTLLPFISLNKQIFHCSVTWGREWSRKLSVRMSNWKWDVVFITCLPSVKTITLYFLTLICKWNVLSSITANYIKPIEVFVEINPFQPKYVDNALKDPRLSHQALSDLAGLILELPWSL